MLRGRRGLRWVVYEEGRLHRVGADELRVVTEPVFVVMETSVCCPCSRRRELRGRSAAPVMDVVWPDPF